MRRALLRLLPAMLILALLALATAAPRGRPAMAFGDGTRGKVAGIALSPTVVPKGVMPAEFSRVRQTGMNSTSLDVWWIVDSPQSNSPHPSDVTTSDAELAQDIQAAKSAGLQVALVPKIRCYPCQRAWRGVLDPSDPQAFFQNYTAMILHYAALARDNDVWLYFIGTEMSSLQGYTEEWRQVAADTRTVYPGRMAYEANWDALNSVGFWDAVDVAGISAFMPLTDTERPDIPELLDSWKAAKIHNSPFSNARWFDYVAGVHAKSNKPVLFGEAGYLSSTYAARQPFDDAGAYDADWQLQADAYQALLQTFEGQSWWMGVLWWQWYVTAAQPTDNDRTPRSKTAETLLSDWYFNNKRPDGATRMVHTDPAEAAKQTGTRPPPPTLPVVVTQPKRVVTQPKSRATTTTKAGAAATAATTTAVTTPATTAAPTAVSGLAAPRPVGLVDGTASKTDSRFWFFTGLAALLLLPASYGTLSLARRQRLT